MTLQKRLAKLEARCHGLHQGPRVIMFNTCWRDDDGNLQRIAQVAKVLSGADWATITRKANEPEAEFHLRAKAMAADLETGSAWTLAVLRRKHATHDPA